MTYNRKAQVDPEKLLVFLVIVALSVGYVYAINKNATELATETIYKDDFNSINLIFYYFFYLWVI